MAEISQSMPQFQYPDLLGSYLRGLSAPGQLQGQQEANTEGALRIDQLRMALGNEQMLRQYFAGQAGGGVGNPQVGSTTAPNGSQINGAQSVSVPTGGIQNGPQGAVSAAPQQGGSYNPSDYQMPSLPRPAIDPRLAPAIAGLGRTSWLDGVQKEFEMQQEIYKSDLLNTQLQASGPLGLAKRVSEAPTRHRSCSTIRASWRSGEPRLRSSALIP